MANLETDAPLGDQLTAAYAEVIRWDLEIRSLQPCGQYLAELSVADPTVRSMSDLTVDQTITLGTLAGNRIFAIEALHEAEQRKTLLLTALAGKVVTARTCNQADTILTFKTDVSTMLRQRSGPVLYQACASTEGAVSEISGQTYAHRDFTDMLVLTNDRPWRMAWIPIVGPDGKQLSTITVQD